MTVQPLSIVAVEPLDDITTFMGTIPAEEYEARKRIRTCRNAASYKVTQTEHPDARALCWIITETATAWLYRPADTRTLEKVGTYLVDLLKAADRAEILEALA